MRTPVRWRSDGGAFATAFYFYFLPPFQMATGIVKKKMDKGFGFITPSEGGEDVFFHLSAFSGSFESLKEGQPVTFEMGMGPKGPKAENVQLAA